MSIRVVGDVHGKLEAYQDGVVYGADYSVQVGDMAYDYSSLCLDHDKHKFFGGNHENYKEYSKLPYALGDFGTRELNGVKFFFVRGAFSIDKDIRVHNYFSGKWPKSWFENEQLSHQELEVCVDNYLNIKPNIMLTHDGPDEATNYITNPDVLRNFGFNPDTFKTVTQQALNSMLRFHRPKLWIFGHYHKKLDVTLDGTRFICLPELGYVDIDAEGNIL